MSEHHDEQLAMPGFIARAIEAQASAAPTLRSRGTTSVGAATRHARFISAGDWPSRIAAGEPTLEQALNSGALFDEYVKPYAIEVRS